MPRSRNDGTPTQAPNKRKLTDVFVASVKPEQRAILVWDTKQSGFALAVQPTGSKSWKAIYRHGCRPRWFHIGDVRAIGLADARRLASKIMLQVAQGTDPQAERTAERGKGTFQELAIRYRDEYASKRNKSWKQAAALIDKYVLPSWGKLSAAAIKRADVERMIARLDDTPTLANQVLAAASVIFSWAIKQEIVESNPCRLIDRNETKSRERVLSDSEIAKFWAAFGDGPVGVALKVNLLTGQRPGEVCRMRREHIDGGWWTLPGEPVPSLGWPGTKNGATHRVWLPEPVQTLLRDLTVPNGTKSAPNGTPEGFVFPRARGRLGDDIREAMRDICDKLGVERATPHDLRRTHGSAITRLGFGRDAMNRIQNHKEGGIADVYDQHGYGDENRKIMEATARHIMTLAEGGGDNVVRFAREKS
jgi:integrase